MRFIFDTGADVVVITMDDARRIGYEADDLRFVVPVVTANGRTMTAPITVDRLTIGDITQRPCARSGRPARSVVAQSSGHEFPRRARLL